LALAGDLELLEMQNPKDRSGRTYYCCSYLQPAWDASQLQIGGKHHHTIPRPVLKPKEV
jgi:hypothetical protein